MSKQLTPEELAQAEQQQSEWIRVQYQKANQYLAGKGIIPDTVAVSESRYLVPYMAIWKLNTRDKKSYWVITGDLPTDHLTVNAATSAREAVRAFSFQWQLKAQQLIDAGVRDKTQEDFANLLINRAHNLYDMFNQEELWQQQSEASA